MIPKTIIKILYGSHIQVKIDFKVKYIWATDFLNEINCYQPLMSKTVYGRRHSELFTNCHVSLNTVFEEQRC